MKGVLFLYGNSNWLVVSVVNCAQGNFVLFCNCILAQVDNIGVFACTCKEDERFSPARIHFVRLVVR